MDREKTVELGNQVYGITPFDMNSQKSSYWKKVKRKVRLICLLKYYPNYQYK